MQKNKKERKKMARLHLLSSSCQQNNKLSPDPAVGKEKSNREVSPVSRAHSVKGRTDVFLWVSVSRLQKTAGTGSYQKSST